MNFRKMNQLIFLMTMVFAFLVLIIFVRDPYIMKMNIAFSQKIQEIGNSGSKPLIFSICYGISFFGITLVSTVMVALFALFFLAFKQYREVIYLLLTPISAGINSLIKIAVNTPRPSANLIQVMVKVVDPGFPSGHVVFYTVFFGFLMVALAKTNQIPTVWRKIIRFVSLVLIITISFSRIYLGAHWFIDVLGGYLEGVIFLSILLFFYSSGQNRNKITD
jgi:membrane-associated phospholipid phosphatase